MGFVASTWDNRDGGIESFECEGACPEPAETCDNSSWKLGNFQVKQWGFTEDIPEDGEEEEEEEDEEEEEEEDED